MALMIPRFLIVKPEYRDYVWGGKRLRPGELTAEAWVIDENDLLASEPLAGMTLGAAAAQFGAELLGKTVVERTGNHFPLLIKLLDCAQWLSLQVHPNDRQAVQLEGPGNYGKTEAWFVLDAAPEARIIAGLKPGTTAEDLSGAIRQGTILDLAQYISVHAGDTVFMPAGTIHALGPGLLVYEVQEASDITYRVFDWNRPQTSTRKLHIEKSLAVANPATRSEAVPLPVLQDGQSHKLCQSEFFTLEMLNAKTQPLTLNTSGRSFHALTVIEGSARISSGGEAIMLNKFDSLIVPAATGEYVLEPFGGFQILKSSL
jgi:mannose-6-phosphate isomerase